MPPASSVASCAAVSMPAASPLVTAQPLPTRARAKVRGVVAPGRSRRRGCRPRPRPDARARGIAGNEQCQRRIRPTRRSKRRIVGVDASRADGGRGCSQPACAWRCEPACHPAGIARRQGADLVRRQAAVAPCCRTCGQRASPGWTCRSSSAAARIGRIRRRPTGGAGRGYPRWRSTSATSVAFLEVGIAQAWAGNGDGALGRRRSGSSVNPELRGHRAISASRPDA